MNLGPSTFSNELASLLSAHQMCPFWSDPCTMISIIHLWDFLSKIFYSRTTRYYLPLWPPLVLPSLIMGFKYLRYCDLKTPSITLRSESWEAASKTGSMESTAICKNCNLVSFFSIKFRPWQIIVPAFNFKFFYFICLPLFLLKSRMNWSYPGYFMIIYASWLFMVLIMLSLYVGYLYMNTSTSNQTQ